ncbi:MAG: alpha/beta hydrolase [Myxococcota bacterium]
MGTIWTILIVGLGLLLSYLGLAVVLARHWRVPWPATETIIRELPTPGHHVVLYHLPPERPRFREPVVICHGLGANRYNVDFVDDGQGRDRSSLARALQRAGFDIWILELRGHGNASVPRGAKWSVDDQVNEDVSEAVQTVLELTNAPTLLWVGHSWGGLLPVLFKIRQRPLSEHIRAIVSIGSPFTMPAKSSIGRMAPMLRRWIEVIGRPIPLRLLSRLVLPAVYLWPRWPRTWSAPLAPMSPGTIRGILSSMTEDIPVGLLRQIVHWVELGYLADERGTPDYERFERLTTPTLLVAGAKDHIAPPSSIAWLRDRAGEDVTMKIMGRGTGCAADYGHGGLILSDRAPDEVFPIIRAWLAARATPLRWGKSKGSNGNGGFVQGGFRTN